MKIIAHRGNINGPDPLTENSPLQILLALSQGFECEIDLWYCNDKLYLGHDNPQYETNINFLFNFSDKLWCHCKHLESFIYLLQFDNLNCFYHQTDDYILTSKRIIWVYPGKSVPKDGIVVMPELYPLLKYLDDHIGGICTDYPSQIKSFLIE